MSWSDLHALDAETGLLSRRLIATLVTTRGDGWPTVTAVWFRIEGERIAISTSSASRKGRDVRIHPHAQLMIQDADDDMGAWGVVFRGPVHIVEGDAARERNQLIYAKYKLPEWSELPEVKAFFSHDDLTLELTPESLRVWDLRRTDAARAARAARAL